MKTGIAILMSVAVGAAALAASAQEWPNEGDTDGDGLTDAFELAQGLDPNKTASFIDGVIDEDRIHPSGRTMFDVQAGATSGAAPDSGSGSGSGKSCGATGLEGLLLSGLTLLFKRRPNRVG